ncbi:AdeC/AdeK/OprM family multidrug efflux complex outer membrane factor [Pseudomonas cavernae]|uniref:AdeC/AdeK/OprM family multidrug efflux complex outer membrane factor n=1 Tax=Pseudomonas cavernae TaxID=2320867 RepID=A0A385Z0N9_9PSED|nr:AdeC/AdeK/OprM family multidrug efflux complex outer membrane factor [Pseudomonas cavernae]AYC32769.1 AdeC/AdeK/OprM family multidrug efflux complex outer membrane factor [Pseudomonas cavernae]
MRKSLLSLAVASIVLSGCSLIPDYQRPQAPIASDWPQGEAYPPAAEMRGESEAVQGWREFFHDPALQQLIAIALDNNRDLRTAALNIQAFQAQYRIQRADLYPSISADANASRQRIPAGVTQSPDAAITSQYSATIGVAWELDLFGRLRSLRDAALEQYFASEEARRGTQISLIANVASAYLTWQADQDLLQLTQETLKAYEDSYSLTRRSYEVGIASALMLSQARTEVESARVRLNQYQRLVAEDRNGLTLLLGHALPNDLQQPLDLNADLFNELPAGLPSELLQRRPDILAAEHQLKAANANIGAARAAFFPSISLTANAGTLSPDLAGMFDGGSGTWLFSPQISVPIFTAGALQANLDFAEVQKNIQVAQYEKAIQTAFQEVADGLTARATYREQLQAQRDLVGASTDYYRLAEKRYRTGIDSNLTFLDAQRLLYNAQQALIIDRLAQLTREVNLYKALGGGWVEQRVGQAPAAAPQS